MHIKYAISLFLTLHTFTIGLSQTVNPQTLLPDVFPVNPKAFEFIKHTEIPVSKYTGIPNISIPIYTIKASGLDIPISLSYHSNGFRVSEEAGWAGLGWTLNAGGQIVQVVNGFDDFGWYRNRDNEAQAMVNASSAPNSILNNCGNVTFFVEPGGRSTDNQSILDFYEDPSMLNGTKDMKPDVFKFNMLGYSGEFILDWATETYKCISDKNIRVESSGSGFHIITPDGSRFYFTLKEETIISWIKRISTIPVSQLLELQHLIGEKSSRVYQLTKIITNGGDIIDFNYIQTEELENLPAVSDLSESYTFNSYTGYSVPWERDPQNIFKSSQSKTINYSKQSFSYLSSIDFPNGLVKFNSTADRIDFIGMRKLNSIDIKDKKNITHKSYSFRYDYFIGHTNGENNNQYLKDGNVYNTGKVSSELTQRLKLLSVTESGKPPYLFDYDENKLPQKTALGTDYWGYYNGTWNGGLRDSYLESAESSVINKITYPTGGSSTFDYELNSFNNYIIPDREHQITSSVNLYDRNFETKENSIGIFMADAPSYLENGTLNISVWGPQSSSTGPFTAYIRKSVLKKTAANLNLVNDPAAFEEIYNSTLPNSLQTKINDVIEDSRILYFELKSDPNQGYETSKHIENYRLDILPGYIYIIQAYLDDSFKGATSQEEGAGAYAYNFRYVKKTPQYISNGAGLRIKSIKTQDQTSPPLIKSYTYTGGKLMSPVILSQKNNFNYGFCSETANDQFCQYMAHSERDVQITRTAQSTNSFYTSSTNASGKYVGYDQVTEGNSIELAGNLIENANGKIVDTYTNTPDIGDFGGNSPIPIVFPLQKAPTENGLTKSSQVFNKDGVVLEHTINSYYPTSAICTYGRISAYFGQYATTFFDCCHEFSIYAVGFYPISSCKTLLGYSTKTIRSGSNTLVTTQDFDYDSYNQLSRITVKNSKDQAIETSYKYPYDFSDYFFTMKSDNFISTVIEKKTELNSETISTTRDYYEPIGGGETPRTYIKRKMQMAKGIEPLEDKVIYDLYGSAEKPDRYKLKQYHTRNGIVTSIVWAYNGQYPVAKIENATYNDVVNALASVGSSPDDIETKSNGSTDETELMTIFNKLRKTSTLSNALITSYTYDPLVGVRTVTDPNGCTTHYEYDNDGRLIQMKDRENKVLKKYKYYYAN